MLAVQVREVLRYDALSLAVPYARATGAPLPGVVYVGIVALATGLAAWRAPRGVAGFTVALAVTLFTTFAFGKKAFCNYYICVIAVLAMAIACARPREGESGTVDDTSGDRPGDQAGPALRPA